MAEREWSLAATLLMIVLAVAARPSQDSLHTLEEPRPETRDIRKKDVMDIKATLKSSVPVLNTTEEAGKKVFVKATTASPVRDSFSSVTNQLLQSPGAMDMVDKDVRTPPGALTHLKEGVVGKGEVTPVELPTKETVEVPSSTEKTQPELSTWVILSKNSEASTVATRRKPTTEVPKYGSKTDKNSTYILHDSKFKNRTPVVVGRLPQRNATVEKVSTTPAPEKKKTTPTPSTTSISITKGSHIPDVVPTTSLLIETGTVENHDEPSTENPTSTTKRTRTTTKKKKNKNRRRRPSKPDSLNIESKIENSNSKIDPIPSRNPITSSFYSYLAREVMPSVGVGLVGLVLTAGLAGLLWYPFGGTVTRRNYEKGPQNQHGQIYYYNDYNPPNVKSDSNAQSEETVFGQVLQNQNQNQNPYNSYKTNTFYYENSNVDGYAGSEYSTIPESVKSDYSALQDSNQYYGEMLSPQYKAGDTSMSTFEDETKYPSLTEYAAYTNAESVGTNGKYDGLKKESRIEPEEVKEDTPQFSPLVASEPEFVGSISVSGSYGTEERHHSGAPGLDHGPRTLKLGRTKREVEMANEIDDSYFPREEVNTTEETPPPPTQTTGTMEPFTDKVDMTTNAPMTTMRPMLNRTEPVSFYEILRSLAQAKLKLGMSFLRATSSIIQRHLDGLSMKMETVLNSLERNETSTVMPPHQRARPMIPLNRRNRRTTKRHPKKH